ncbi:MAG: sensor domain-containing diguanylate cyclase [Lachnospiraceae bacterium]|nr:sensor domain-containing diguanylate cyclase [Lachnospiraceae bacterium]
MKNLKKMISHYLWFTTISIVIVILLIASVAQFLNEQEKARDSAYSAFIQIEQLLNANQNDLVEVTQAYRETCLHNAETIAYIIESKPEVLNSTRELIKIAEFIEVDEIHVFDNTGRIFTGTHPKYYDLTMDSGEQIGFFKPLLEDKSLKLCQDITPNTAEAKLMQYSALWSTNGEYIVQVGMEPVNVMRVTEKNELSYIFSGLRVNIGVDFYAIDEVTGEIVGATNSDDLGKQLTEIGLNMGPLLKDTDGFHAKVNGVQSFCIFKEYGDTLIGRVISNDILYEQIPSNMIGLIFCFTLVAFIQVFAVSKYMNRYVVDGISDVNEKLRSITAGNLDEHVDVRNSLEFVELSEHINDMIKSLMDNNRKMSYVLSKTNMYMGVYEYNEHMKTVCYTEYIPRILRLEKSKVDYLASDYALFKEYIEKLQTRPVPGEEGIFMLEDDAEGYVRLEEIHENNAIFGVLIDMSEEMGKRKKIESERDLDSLTGLYNRRGIDRTLEAMFKDTHSLEYGALVMMDADGLKEINDKYGHEKGDIYLKEIADMINSLGFDHYVCARQGGDEFVLFLYNFESEELLLQSLEKLHYMQQHSTAKLDEQLVVPLKFSYGYTLIQGRRDYLDMLKEADDKMYENKRQRKLARV